MLPAIVVLNHEAHEDVKQLLGKQATQEILQIFMIFMLKSF